MMAKTLGLVHMPSSFCSIERSAPPSEQTEGKEDRCAVCALPTKQGRTSYSELETQLSLNSLLFTLFTFALF